MFEIILYLKVGYVLDKKYYPVYTFSIIPVVVLY